MKRKSFTLIEILVGLIIISILAALSMASYRKTIETNNERICRENLKTLWKAIDIYTMENDALPATLAQLTPQQIYLAHSQVVGEAKENHFTAALRNILGIKPALAQSLAKYYASNRNVFRCPADTAAAAPAAGSCNVNTTSVFSCIGSSYSFDLTSATYDSTTKRLKKGTTATPNMTPLISDSGDRHRRQTQLIKLGITPGGTVGKVTNTTVDPNYASPSS